MLNFLGNMHLILSSLEVNKLVWLAENVINVNNSYLILGIVTISKNNQNVSLFERNNL